MMVVMKMDLIIVMKAVIDNPGEGVDENDDGDNGDGSERDGDEDIDDNVGR